MKNTGKFAVTGGLAGLCNGLFGAGGGLFLVPLLTQWAGLEPVSYTHLTLPTN